MFARPWTTVILFTSLSLVGAAGVNGQDPPGRVGRVSVADGNVSFRSAQDTTWAAAVVNYPFVDGDRLWADQGARAEVQFDASDIHLASLTGVQAESITDAETRVSVTEGTVEATVRAIPPGRSYELDTPNGSIALLRPGAYRVDVDSSGAVTTLSVRDGDAEVTAAGRSMAVHARQAVSLTSGPTTAVQSVPPLPVDDFERWVQDRDAIYANAPDARYVSTGMVGYPDLGAFGAWQVDGVYGPVWYPRVVVGWAPYRVGRWAWVAPWGWTWVDDAPWGFAPFHYGRWVFVAGRWGWVPGAVVARPVWAPALVAWVGGPNWGVAFGGGPAVGWFPLAPNEVYIPAYRASPVYVRSVNVTSVRNIQHIDVTRVDVTHISYINQRVPGAVTAVPEKVFAAGRQVGAAHVAVSPSELRGAQVLAHGVAVRPEPSALGPSRPTAYRPPPRAVQPASARRAPAAPERPGARAPAVEARPASTRAAAPPAPPAAPAPGRSDRPNGPPAAASRAWSESLDQMHARQQQEFDQLRQRQSQELQGARTQQERAALQQRHWSETQVLQARHAQEFQSMRARSNQKQGNGRR